MPFTDLAHGILAEFAERQAPVSDATWSLPADAARLDAEYRDARKVEFRARQRVRGRCRTCAEPVYKGSRCRKHYEEHKAYGREWARAKAIASGRVPKTRKRKP